MRFWDLLSTRYADPFSVMDTMIYSGMLPEFIDNMVEQANEDKLWQLYLAVALMEDRSFSDWKAAVLSDGRGEAKLERQERAAEDLSPEEAVAHAEGILAGFKPF